MRETPPHLLLTNYAMLEYLLVRPDDCVFFEGDHSGRWQFLVLDEAHTYDGAMGIETAMLLRRLKDRVGAPELRCIATSATLGRGRADFPEAVRFAEALFDAPFRWNEADPGEQDVIEAERVRQDALGEAWGTPDAALYDALHAAFEGSTSSFSGDGAEARHSAELAVEDRVGPGACESAPGGRGERA